MAPRCSGGSVKPFREEVEPLGGLREIRVTAQPDGAIERLDLGDRAMERRLARGRRAQLAGLEADCRLGYLEHHVGGGHEGAQQGDPQGQTGTAGEGPQVLQRLPPQRRRRVESVTLVMYAGTDRAYRLARQFDIKTA